VNQAFRQQLENHNQPEEVRQRLAAGLYNSPNDKIAQEYLDSLERDERAKSSTRAEAREEEILSIARKALEVSERATRNSERATRIAISAITLSISMAILAIIQWYSK